MIPWVQYYNDEYSVSYIFLCCSSLIFFFFKFLSILSSCSWSFSLKNHSAEDYSCTASNSHRCQNSFNTHVQAHCQNSFNTQHSDYFVERKHRHIIKITLTYKSRTSIPLSYWSYMFCASVYIINKLHPLVLQHLSPWQKLFHIKPDYRHLKTLSFSCHPYLKTLQKTHPSLLNVYFSNMHLTQRVIFVPIS